MQIKNTEILYNNIIYISSTVCTYFQLINSNWTSQIHFWVNCFFLSSSFNNMHFKSCTASIKKKAKSWNYLTFLNLKKFFQVTVSQQNRFLLKAKNLPITEVVKKKLWLMLRKRCCHWRFWRIIFFYLFVTGRVKIITYGISFLG